METEKMTKTNKTLYYVNRAVMAYVYILHAFIVRKCRFDDFE